MRALFDEAALDEKENLGQWFLFDEIEDGDVDKTVKVEFRIRAVPDEVLQRIHKRHFGPRQELKHVKNAAISSWEAEASRLAALDKAVYALTHTRHFTGRPKEENVERYTQLLGRPVHAGEVLVFDEVLAKRDDSARQLKEHVLGQFSDVVAWINEKSDEQKLKAKEQREQLKS